MAATVAVVGLKPTDATAFGDMLTHYAGATKEPRTIIAIPLSEDANEIKDMLSNNEVDAILIAPSRTERPRDLNPYARALADTISSLPHLAHVRVFLNPLATTASKPFLDKGIQVFQIGDPMEMISNIP